MIKAAVAALVAFLLAPAVCRAQARAWRCSDPRIGVSLWSGEVVRGTQMRFAPDGSLWVLELRGRLLRLVETEHGVVSTVVLELKDLAFSTSEQMGATSFVFASDFDGRSGTMYLSHNWDGKDGRRLGGVSRAVLDKDRSPRVERVYGPIPSAISHQVDRLVFDGDDLLLSVGDMWQPSLSQSDDDPHGKVLRFSNAAKADSKQTTLSHQIEAKGLRSPFALGRRASDGLVIIGNNGPSSNDALYVLRKGANYGWGLAEGQEPPDVPFYLWPRTVSPDAVCFYEPGKEARYAWPGEYHGNLLVGLFGLVGGAGPEKREGRGELERGRQVLRLELTGAGASARVGKASVLLTYVGSGYECPLDLAVGPRGDLFLMTFSMDRQGSGTSKIYRLRAERAGEAMRDWIHSSGPTRF